jgi:phenylalanyl-tRNA synthetase alpha chain
MHKYEKLVLKAMATGSPDLPTIISIANIPEDSVLRALKALEEIGAAKIDSSIARAYALTPEGKQFLQSGFPEQILLDKLSNGRLDVTIEEKRIGIPWAIKNGWMKFSEAKEMLPTQKGMAEHKAYAPQALAKRIGENSMFPLREGEKEILEALVKRGSVSYKDRSTYSAKITPEGMKLAQEIGEIKEEISILDREQITSKKWKTAELSRYNTTAPVERVFPGKRHPIAQLTEKIRFIFSEMGFVEMDGEPVESAFWNFDALFQPQDHPAREMADTFYLKEKGELPDYGIVNHVKEAHEKGWKYKWDPEVAKGLVLRTHTTAVSARYVAKSKGTPSKNFCVGRVYRNEQTDFKHLAEFFQVEGIVVWEKATFCDLLGLLKEFYKKLGFEKIRFRPSYFPYTEPSVEVEAFFEDRNEWLELGGAGVFRPEVCLPLCGKYPVLAWGLSLERPLMLSQKIDDIRTFYKNDIEWLRNSKRGI